MRIKWTVVLSFLFVLLSVSFSSAAEEELQDSFSIKTSRHVLENGLTVLISEMPTTETVGVYVLIKTGAALEGKYLGSGISHFTEHMLFKGTQKRGVGVIAKEVKALGGLINASTGFDRTVYFIEVHKDHFAKAVDILADMVQNAAFDPEEVKSEQHVILDEIRMHNDNPYRKLSQLIFSTMYTRHPYRHPVAGYTPLFKKITREDLLDYYQTKYIPSNMIFSVAGDLDEEDALTTIKSAFDGFEPTPYIPRNLPKEPEQISLRMAEVYYPTQLTRLTLAYRSVSLMDKDLFALDVLAMALGSGRTSRLYKQIYDQKRLVHSVSASNYTPVDPGLLEIECVLDEEKVEETIDALKEEIAQVQKNGLGKTELEKVKRRVLSQYIFEKQTAGGIAYDTMINEAFAGDYAFSKAYVQGIKNITNEDIKRVARQYLVDSSLTIAVLRPQKDAEASKEKEVGAEKADIQKFVLSNGLTVLLREDPTLPIVSMTVALNGGTRKETEEKSGLSALTSRLWVRETKSRSAEKLAEQVESLGASFGPFSGRNSFGIRFNLLSEDLDFALGLIEDVVKNPRFSEKEFRKEKEKLRSSIIARNDNINAVTSRELMRILFPKHYFRLEKLGTLESMEKIAIEDVRGFYQELVAPNNMVLSILGDFDAAEILPRIKDRFEKLAEKEILFEPSSNEQIPGTQEKTVTLDKEQAILMIGFRGPSMKDLDRFPMDLITSILGSSLSGRMFTKIRDEMGKAYTLGAGYTPGIDTGVVSFYVNTKEESIDQVKDILVSLIQEIREDLVTSKELEDSQIYRKGAFYRGLETNSALGFMSSLDELYGLGFDNYKSYAEHIDAVTKEDIRRVAVEYLDISKAVIVKCLPEKRSKNK